MKIRKALALICLSGLLAVTASGCGTIESFFEALGPEPEIASEQDNVMVANKGEGYYASPYTPGSIINYRLAREYAAAGRYELAREHYLLALAAANDGDMREALVGELKSVDMMIKSLR